VGFVPTPTEVPFSERACVRTLLRVWRDQKQRPTRRCPMFLLYLHEIRWATSEALRFDPPLTSSEDAVA
jgi:hypothetical protein